MTGDMSKAVFPRAGAPKLVIYKITNIVNWKGYVGQTTTGLAQRVASHKYESGSSAKKRHIIADAIQKYGLEKFFFQILEVCKSIEDLDERERFWIAACGTRSPKGYNLTPGGSGAKSITEATRLKMSLAKKGKPTRPMSDYNKQRLKEGRLAAGPRPMSESHKAKLAILTKARSAEMNAKYTPDQRKRDMAKRIGVPVHNDAWKKAHSALVSGSNNPFFGKKHDAATREKIKAGMKRFREKQEGIGVK